MHTRALMRRTVAAAVAIAAAAAIAGCGDNYGNGDSVTRNGVTSEPAKPSPSNGG